MSALELNINNVARKLDTDSSRSLLSVLREDLDLTGSKYGCGEGQCGACTVLVEGSPVRSCRIQASAVSGKKISTIEGLGRGGELDPVQQAFLEVEAFQCGYCTPGMVLSAAALLDHTPNPTREQIIRRMDGNLCRCGTYPRIVEAVERAAELKRKRKHATAG